MTSRKEQEADGGVTNAVMDGTSTQQVRVISTGFPSIGRCPVQHHVTERDEGIKTGVCVERQNESNSFLYILATK